MLGIPIKSLWSGACYPKKVVAGEVYMADSNGVCTDRLVWWPEYFKFRLEKREDWAVAVTVVMASAKGPWIEQYTNLKPLMLY